MGPRPVTFVLWNAVMAMPLRRYGRADLLASRILVARLLRIGLGISEISEEEDAWTRLHGLSAASFLDLGPEAGGDVETHRRWQVGRRSIHGRGPDRQ